MEDVNRIKEPLPIVPVKCIRIIKEGVAVQTSESEKKYRQSRHSLFSPWVKSIPEAIDQVLQNRETELADAIKNSTLGAATDRDGLPLGSLKELTSLALRELRGEVEAKNVLKRVLEMVTDEEERSVMAESRDEVREGITFNKNGSIWFQSFPNPYRKKEAAARAYNMKSDFLKGKDKLQQYISELK